MEVTGESPPQKRFSGQMKVSFAPDYAFAHSRPICTSVVGLLRLEFVEVVEGILQRHASDAAESCLKRELLQLPFWQTQGAKSLSMAMERGGHAVEHTEPIEQAP